MSIPGAGRPSDYFEATYGGVAPWEIGKPQPALMALFDEYPPAGPVLDVGCGTGELSMALVARGLEVLGIDTAPGAIAQAQSKMAAGPHAGLQVEFRVVDALHLALLPGPFGAVVDSGFYHLFGPLERQDFANELAAALVGGGQYYLLGFAIASPFPNVPRPVLESELRALFAPELGWRILALRPACFLIRSPRGSDVPALAACVERSTWV